MLSDRTHPRWLISCVPRVSVDYQCVIAKFILHLFCEYALSSYAVNSNDFGRWSSEFCKFLDFSINRFNEFAWGFDLEFWKHFRKLQQCSRRFNPSSLLLWASTSRLGRLPTRHLDIPIESVWWNILSDRVNRSSLVSSEHRDSKDLITNASSRHTSGFCVRTEIYFVIASILAHWFHVYIAIRQITNTSSRLSPEICVVKYGFWSHKSWFFGFMC